MKSRIISKPIEAVGFVCLPCGTFWRDDKVKREACPFCGMPRRDCGELVLVLGKEAVDVPQPLPGADKCGTC